MARIEDAVGKIGGATPGAYVQVSGGATQYADGATVAAPTGTQINFNESGTQRAVSLSKPLPVVEISTPITGQSLEVGGTGLLGWLSSIRKAITDRLPSALTGSGNLKVAIVESTTQQTTSTTARTAAAANVNAPTANTAAVITYAAAGAGVSHVISGLAWSYNATPTSGNLKVEDGSGTTVFSVDITSAGPGFIPFQAPLKGTANTAMIVTLTAGGSGVTGKISVLGKWSE